jgi:hypothetical protein
MSQGGEDDTRRTMKIEKDSVYVAKKILAVVKRWWTRQNGQSQNFVGWLPGWGWVVEVDNNKFPERHIHPGNSCPSPFQKASRGHLNTPPDMPLSSAPQRRGEHPRLIGSCSHRLFQTRSSKGRWIRNLRSAQNRVRLDAQRGLQVKRNEVVRP